VCSTLSASASLLKFSHEEAQKAQKRCVGLRE
jgi:hypothetical protein